MFLASKHAMTSVYLKSDLLFFAVGMCGRVGFAWALFLKEVSPSEFVPADTVQLPVRCPAPSDRAHHPSGNIG